MRRLAVLLVVLATAVVTGVPGVADGQEARQTVTLCVSGASDRSTAEELTEGITSGSVVVEAVGPCPAASNEAGPIAPAPTAPVSNACELVPGIESIVGRELLLGGGLNLPSGSDVTCAWSFNDHPYESVTLTLGRPELWDDTKAALDLFGGIEELDQEWLWTLGTAMGDTLLARSPAMVAVVSVTLEDDSRAQEIALAIANTALGG